MKGLDRDVYCTVQEAAAILGLFPQELRDRINAGRMDLGEVIHYGVRTEYKLEKTKVLKQAGLTVWPEEVATRPLLQRVEAAAEQLDEVGIDVTVVADILRQTCVLSKIQADRMIKAMRADG